MLQTRSVRQISEFEASLVIAKLNIRYRVGHYIFKGKISQEDSAILIVYASNTMAFKFIKETMLTFKSHVDPHTLIVRDFDTSFLPIEDHLDKI